MRRLLVRPLLVLATLSGCSGLGHPGGPGNNPPDPAADQAQYQALQMQLDQGRSQAFDKSATELDGEGAVLYYKTYESFSPVLHRKDSSGAKLAYGFSIGAGDDNNYRASADVVVNAEAAGDHVTYHAFDASLAQASLGDVDFPSPEGAKWWAYAVSGQDIYVVANPDGTANNLYHYTAGATGTPEILTTLEAASGSQVGEFYDFAVDGSTMIYIESGRIWKLDLVAKHATWLMNQIQVSSGAEFEKDGVLFSTEDGKLLFYGYADGALRTLSDEIMASSYQLNDTYKTAHYFYQDYARYQSSVIYVGLSGVFAYDLTQRSIKPILLSPADTMNRTDYRYPVTLDSGALYVTGLMSTDGAVGADGPVFQVDLNQALK